MFNVGDKVRFKTLDEIGDITSIMWYTQKDLIDSFGTGPFVVQNYLDGFVFLPISGGHLTAYAESRFVLFEEPHVFDVDGLEKLI